jgi:hypothetical protein
MRHFLRHLHYNHPIDHMFTPFLPAQTEEATMQSSSSMATGPDDLTALHLKHLGPVRDAVIPAIWKTALVLPVPKPGKPADQGTFYRPISLLTQVMKILERLVLPSLTAAFT